MLSGSLQENLITMLVYDDRYASIIRNSVSISLWSVPYRLVAVKCYEHLDQFKIPPKDHIADLLEDKLGKEDGESVIFSTLLVNMHNTSLNGINSEFVLNRLAMFIRRQSLRSIAVELTKALQEDTEESLEKADRLMSQAKRNELQLFDPGTRLNDKTKALRFLDYVNESFPTGIPELDRRGFGPTRKELWMLVGDAKSGKSMSLTHLAKMAIINRLKVVHVTLEMSEGRVAQRYFQTLYSVAKRPDISELVKFKKDAKGDLLGFNSVKLAPNMTLQDSGIRQKLEQIIDKRALRHLNNIYIKEYATGYLTMPMLQGYLDNLEATHKFSPDMLIVDYPDLMKVNSDNYRLSIDQIYKDLRGMAVERNIAVAVVSQSNRAGSKKKTLGSENIAEAYSKVQHADITITLSATAAEKRLGLARLYVTNARNDEGSLTLVISQNYRTGTFAVDAAVMSSNYWDLLPSNEEDQDQ